MSRSQFPPPECTPWVKAAIEGTLAGVFPTIWKLSDKLAAAEKELVRLREIEAVARVIIASGPADPLAAIGLLESALGAGSEGNGK